MTQEAPYRYPVCEVPEPRCENGQIQNAWHDQRVAAFTSVEPLIDAAQAARILKLHPVTVREMAGQGRLPGLKIGKVWRFRASSLDAWIDSQLQSVRYPQSPESEEG